MKEVLQNIMFILAIITFIVLLINGIFAFITQIKMERERKRIVKEFTDKTLNNLAEKISDSIEVTVEKASIEEAIDEEVKKAEPKKRGRKKAEN